MCGFVCTSLFEQPHIIRYGYVIFTSDEYCKWFVSDFDPEYEKIGEVLIAKFPL